MVRLGSPTLNYFIVGGALVMYVSVLFYVMPTDTADTTSAFCNVSEEVETRWWLTLLYVHVLYASLKALEVKALLHYHKLRTFCS